MPQLVENMKVNTQNKFSCNLKNNCFKMRNAPDLNRYRALKTIRKSIIFET